MGLALAGLLDDDPGIEPKHHIFVSDKAPWWRIADSHPQYEEYPPGFDPPCDPQ